MLLRFYHKAKQILEDTFNDGGSTTFTINVLDEDKQGTVYIVGDGKHEVKLHRFTHYTQLVNTVALYLNSFLFDADADTIGTWLDGDFVYLDTGKLFNDLGEAISFAKEHNELAIFDFTNKEVIDVN